MYLQPLCSFCRHSNVVILTTSNVTEKIDLAFIDRADIKQYIGPPSVKGIYSIYLSCLEELMKVTIAFFPMNVFRAKSPLLAWFAVLRKSTLWAGFCQHKPGRRVYTVSLGSNELI